MKKYFLSIMLVTGSGTMYAQDVSTAKWMAHPVTIDGEATEWHQPLNFYDSETKLLFAISNDSTHIYLCFEAKDEATQMKIMRAGMRVELDTKGRNGRSASIDFPLPPKERDENEEGGNDFRQRTGDTTGGQFNHKPDMAMMHQRFLQRNITMDVKGFADGNGIIPVRGRDISVAMNWDDADDLFYEVSIPIKSLLDDGYTAGDVLKEITLHAEVNGIKGAEGGGRNAGAFNGGGMGRGGGGMRGGGGGMRGGGMRGGGMQGSGMDRSSLGEKTSFKQKFVLGANTPQ